MKKISTKVDPFAVKKDSLFELSEELKGNVLKQKSLERKSPSKPISIQSSPISDGMSRKTDKVISELKKSFEEVKKSISQKKSSFESRKQSIISQKSIDKWSFFELENF